MVNKAHNLACPLDGTPLILKDKQLVCASGHSFDVARQGYINLLPVQQKRSKNPGDSKEMVVARSTFLDTGVYAPIADTLNQINHELIAGYQHQEICLLDAGCGEGYYLQHLLRYLDLKAIHQHIAFIGLDISKPAIVAAAKRSKQITWLVASNKQPPILPGTIDTLFSLFGFPLYESFSKLLKPGGKLILLDAGPAHLIELRKLIYPTINKAEPTDFSAAQACGFIQHYQSQVTYVSKNISNSQVMNLLTMTPHLYRASKEGKQTVSLLDTLDLTIDVTFTVLELDQNNCLTL